MGELSGGGSSGGNKRCIGIRAVPAASALTAPPVFVPLDSWSVGAKGGAPRQHGRATHTHTLPNGTEDIGGLG